MTNEELNKLMGLEVMKWTIDDFYDYPMFHENNEDHWNPTEDMNQAMMCVKKYLSENPFMEFVLENNMPDEGWIVTIRSMAGDSEEEYHQVLFNTAPLAICQCIAKAIGESDE